MDATVDGELEVTRGAGSWKINTDPVTVLTTNGQWYGEALSIGDIGSGVVAGNVYYLSSSSTWIAADADAASSSRNLLAIATTAAGFNRGMLIRGYFKNTSWSFTIGAPVYLSVTAGGLSSTQPTGTADIVRVVGYAIAADELYFNPSNDWVELA